MLDNFKKLLAGLIAAGLVCGFIAGCEKGDKVIEKATGKESLDQYKAVKDQLKGIDEKQKERYRNIPGDEPQENK